MNYKLALLAGPSIPITGVNTSLPGPYLAPSEVESAVNLRIKGGWQSREGIALLGPETPFASGQRRGEAHAFINGDDFLVLARRESSQTLIYLSDDLGATWAEITGNDASGPYGVTRFGNDGEVTFAVVKDRGRSDIDESDCLVIQNGIDAPRIYALDKENVFGDVTDYIMATAPDPVTPADTLTLNRTFGTTGFEFGGSVVNSGANFTITTDGELQARDGTTNADTAELIDTGIPGVLDLTGIKQLILVVKDLVGNPILPNVDFEIGDGTDWEKLFGAGEIFQKCAIALTDDLKDGYQTFQIGIPVPTEMDPDRSAIDRFRFTWGGGTVTETIFETHENFTVSTDNDLRRPDVGWGVNQWANYWVRIASDPTTPASVGQYRRIVSNTDEELIVTPDWTDNPSGEAIFEIIDVPRIAYVNALTEGGLYQGGTDFAIAFANSATRAEGPARIATVKTGFEPYGANADPSLPDAIFDSRFYAYYRLAFDYPSPVSSLNVARIYSNELGLQDDYSYVATLPISVWDSGAWTVTGTDNLYFYAGETQDLITILPAGTTGVPIGKAMEAMNERLFVAPESRVYYSRFQRPFAFSKAAIASDDSSSSSFSVDGERVQAMAALGSYPSGAETLGSPQIGSSQLFILTDRTLSIVYGWDATSLNKRSVASVYGTLYPKSLARTRQGIVYLSSEGQIVQQSGYQTRLLSWKRVDASLSPSSPIMSAAWVRDKYYLLLDSDTILIYDEPQNAPFFDTTPEGGYAALLAYRGSTSKLLAFSDDDVYEHEQPGKAGDLEEDTIDVAIDFREIRAPSGSALMAGQIHIECDPDDDATLTATRVARGRESVTSVSAAMSLASSGARVMRLDIGDDDEVPGLISQNVSIGISATVPSLWNLHEASIEVTVMDGFGPDILS